MYETLRAARIATPILAAWLLATPATADDFFELSSFDAQGRSVAGEFADLNGDGRTDFFIATLSGIPPEERRTIGVYLQTKAGGFPPKPNHRVVVPEWSAVYDVADLIEESPGMELVLLQPDGVTLLSVSSPEGVRRKLLAPGPTTVGLADDERGFEPYKLVYDDFGDEPWILVPQIGQLSALTADGTVKAQVAVPRRANYLILPQTGLVSIESDFQIFLDVPKLAIGDINGDGRVDIASSTRHEIRVFLRREDGSFPKQPDRQLPLRLVKPRDHIRASGGVASEIKDIDGDGLVDLLVSHVEGGFGDATTTIYVYLNRDGGWDLDKPLQKLTSDASLGSNALYDVDRDGHRELLRLEFRFSVFEVVEILLSREIDIDISIHRWQEEGGFDEDPWTRKKISIPFSFETFRPKGFIPTANIDVNTDGFLDFVSSGSGEQIEIHLGDKKGPFARRGGRQDMETAGVIHFGDFNGDGLPDFLLFDPHNFDVPIQVGKNLGMLPGTPPRIRAR